MIELFSVLSLLLPLVPIILLSRATSAASQRAWTYLFGLFLLLMASWYVLIRYALTTLKHVNVTLLSANPTTGTSLFNGSVGSVLQFFFTHSWLAVCYLLTVCVGAYLSKRHSLRR